MVEARLRCLRTNRKSDTDQPVPNPQKGYRLNGGGGHTHFLPQCPERAPHENSHFESRTLSVGTSIQPTVFGRNCHRGCQRTIADDHLGGGAPGLDHGTSASKSWVSEGYYGIAPQKGRGSQAFSSTSQQVFCCFPCPNSKCPKSQWLRVGWVGGGYVAQSSKLPIGPSSWNQRVLEPHRSMLQTLCLPRLFSGKPFWGGLKGTTRKPHSCWGVS